MYSTANQNKDIDIFLTIGTTVEKNVKKKLNGKSIFIHSLMNVEDILHLLSSVVNVENQEHETYIELQCKSRFH